MTNFRNRRTELSFAAAVVTVLGLMSACGSNPTWQSLLPDGGVSAADAAATIDAMSAPDATPVIAVADISGAWQFESGSFFTQDNAPNLQFLSLDATGSGAVYSTSDANNFKGCAGLTYAVVNNNIVSMSVGNFGTHAKPAPRAVHRPTSSGAADHGEQACCAIQTTLLNYAQPDANTLVLTDDNGLSASFSRVDSVGSAACAPFNAPVEIAVPDSAPLAAGNGLAADDTGIWYPTTQGSLSRINPSDSTINTPIDFASGEPQVLLTMDGADFWLYTGCCGAQVQRWTQGGVNNYVVDLSQPPLSNSNFQIISAAADGTDLWLAGNDCSHNCQRTLLDIDTAGENFVVKSTFVYGNDINFQAYEMTFAAGRVWIGGNFVSHAIFEIDPTTGDAIETYSLPDLGINVEYNQGLAALSGDFYFSIDHFSNDSDTYSLLQLSIPQ